MAWEKIDFDPFGLEPEAPKKPKVDPRFPLETPYDPFAAFAQNDIAARGDKVKPWPEKAGPGLFGDSWGMLAPDEQKAELDSRFSDLDKLQKQISNHERVLAQATNPSQRRVIEGQLNYLRSIQPDIDQLHLMEAGDKPLPTKTGLRSGVENAISGFTSSVLSVPEFAGIVKGYLGPGQVDDDSLVKWSLGAKDYAKSLFPGDEARAADFSQQLASGAGQIASFYGAGALAALLKAGPKAMAAVVAGMGSAATGAGGFEEGTAELKAARDKAAAEGRAADVTEYDRLLKFLGYSAVGTTEAIPVARTFSRAVPNPGSALEHRFIQGAEGAIEEALQESGSQLAQNLITQQTTNPNRATSEGVVEGGAVGGVLGGLINFLMPGRFGGAQQTQQPGATGPEMVETIAPQLPPPGPTEEFRGTLRGQTVPPSATSPSGQVAGSSMGEAAAPAPARSLMGQTATIPLGGPTQSVEPPRQIQAPRPPVIDVQAEPVPPVARARGVQRQSFTEGDLHTIGVDAPLMQFKEGGDAAGVTDRLKGVKEWDAVRAGNAIVYEFADGRRIIADGHQRLGLAKRLAGEGKEVDFDAFIFREVDGFTPQQVRSIAAIKNIAEGSGSSLDAAKVLRELGQTPADLNLPPNSALARDAAGLSKLGDDAFGMVVNDLVPKPYAAIVGQEVADPQLQTNIMGLLARIKPASALEARAIVAQAKQATVESTQENLFGAETTIESLYGERAKVLAEAARQLRANKRVFQTLLNNEEEAEKAGNVLNRNENERQARASAILSDIIERLAYATGPISNALTVAARDYKSTGKLSRAGKQFADAVTDSLVRGEIDGLRIGGIRSEAEGATAQGEAEVDTETVDMFGGTTDRINLLRDADPRPTASAQAPEIQQPQRGDLSTADVLSALSPRQAPSRDIDQLGYYSKALEEAKALKQERGTPEQMLAMLRKAGVKESEIKATGLDKLIAGKTFPGQNEKPSITKQEIIDHLTQNRTRLQESRYGNLPLERRGDPAGRPRREEEAYEGTGMTGSPRWAQYSLDRDNPTYQETVVHLPSAPPRDEVKPDPEIMAQYQAEWDDLTAKIQALDDVLWAPGRYDEQTPVMMAERGRLSDQREALHQRAVDETIVKNAGRYPTTDYRSGHWDEPNTVAHIRSAIFTDVKGRKVYNLDELQSDWGQKVREGGGRDDAKVADLQRRHAEAVRSLRGLIEPAKERLRELDFLGFDGWPGASNAVRRSADWRSRWDVTDAEAGPIQDYVDAVNREALLDAELRTAVALAPSHPLINTTDQWVETAMRRVIQQAVDAGADGISITPGAVQNERYRLSSVINGAEVDTKMDFGRRQIMFKGSRGDIVGSVVVDPDGTVFNASEAMAQAKGQPLSAVVGEAAAQRLMEAKNGWVSVEEMEVGGEGMKATYDKIYPRTLGKLLQKLDKEIKPERVKLLPHNYTGRERMSLEELREGTPFAQDFIFFPLTEKAKAAVREEGQPLFALAGMRAKTADLPSQQLAERMEGQGRDPRNIFELTGWLRGPDMGWRFEIDDSDARITNLGKITEKPTKSLVGRIFGSKPVKIGSNVRAVNNVPLTDLLHHPKLYAAYPFLRKMRVDLVYGPGLGRSGALRTREERGKTIYRPIRVTAGSEKDILSVLLHEIQHYIQNHEGFAQGSDVPRDRSVVGSGGTSGVRPPLYDPAQRGVTFGWRQWEKRILDATHLEGMAEDLLRYYELEQSDDLETRRMARSDIARAEYLLEEAMRAGPDTYSKSFGEYEARLVQDRLEMTAPERRRAYPLANMPEGLVASRTQTRDYQQAYDEIMRRAMVNRAIKARWAERQPIGAGISVIRPMEDALYYFKDDGGEMNRSGNMVSATLHPTVAGAVLKPRESFYELPYEQQKPIMDAISRDIRSRNMRPTVEGWQSDLGFEFWKRYDPSQIISDPRLYRPELEAAVAREYGPNAQLILYGDINPENGLAYGESGNVDEPFDVYVKVPGSGQRQAELEVELERLRDRHAAVDQGPWPGPPEQRQELNQLENRIAELEDEVAYVSGDIQAVPRGVIGDIIPQFESAFSKAAEGIDKDIWMSAQIDDALRERGLLRDGQFALAPRGAPRLAALHNLSAENLAFADRMGGIAVPSVAVVKEGMGIEGFGEITLIGRTDLADPTRNPVFDADAYTARFPQPTYKKVPSSKVQPIVTRLRPFEQRTGDHVTLSNIWDDMVNTPKPEEVVRSALNGAATMAAFLDSRGIALPPMQERDGATPFSDARGNNKIELRRVIEADPELAAAFRDWVDATFMRHFGEPTLKVGGKNAPYTLPNIVKVMRGRGVKTKADAMFFSEEEARAAVAKRFTSLRGMRKAADERMLSGPELEQMREVAQKLLSQFREDVAGYYPKKRNIFDSYDAAMRAVSRAAMGTPSADGLRRAMEREEFVGLPDELINQGLLGLNAFMAAPVPYFESKPQRAVDLDEFAGAVIPDNASPETKRILEKHGIPVKTYVRDGGRDSQQKAAAAFTQELAESGQDTLFALKGFYSPTYRAVEAIKQEKATPEQWLSMISKAPGVKADELKWLGLEPWLKDPLRVEANYGAPVPHLMAGNQDVGQDLPTLQRIGVRQALQQHDGDPQTAAAALIDEAQDEASRGGYEPRVSHLYAVAGFLRQYQPGQIEVVEKRPLIREARKTIPKSEVLQFIQDNEIDVEEDVLEGGGASDEAIDERAQEIYNEREAEAVEEEFRQWESGNEPDYEFIVERYLPSTFEQRIFNEAKADWKEALAEWEVNKARHDRWAELYPDYQFLLPFIVNGGPLGPKPELDNFLTELKALDEDNGRWKFIVEDTNGRRDEYDSFDVDDELFDTEEEAREAAEAKQAELQAAYEKEAEAEKESLWESGERDWLWHEAQASAREELGSEEGETQWSEYAIEGGDREDYRELLIRLPDILRRYSSPHYTSNEVVHLRFDDRQSPLGKTLFIHEIQSDLHQRARRFGFGKDGLERAIEAVNTHGRTPELKAKIDEATQQLSRARALGDGILEGQVQEQLDALQTEAQQIASAGTRYVDTFQRYGGAPEAPYTGNGWWELAFKRALAWAADGGYDAIALTNAQQIHEASSTPMHVGEQFYEKNLPGFADKYLKQWGVKRQATSISGQEGRIDWEVADMEMSPQALLDWFDGVIKFYTQQQGYPDSDYSIEQRNQWQRVRNELTELRDNGAPADTLRRRILDEQTVAGAAHTGIPAVNLPPLLRMVVEPTNFAWKITPEMRQSLEEKGQPLFADSPAKTKKIIEVMLRLGRPWVVEPEKIAQAHQDLAEASVALPTGTEAWVLSRIENLGKEKGKAVLATFVNKDNEFYEAQGDTLSDVTESRAVYFPSAIGVTPRVLLIGPSLGGQFGETLRGELRHEAIHALRGQGRLTGRVWSDLVYHASKLSILDFSARKFYDAIGVEHNYTNDIPLGAAYHEAYDGRKNYNEAMDQEAVAHMVELYSHNVLTPQQVEPIKHILDAILRGDFKDQAHDLPTPAAVLPPAIMEILREEARDYRDLIGFGPEIDAGRSQQLPAVAGREPSKGKRKAPSIAPRGPEFAQSAVIGQSFGDRRPIEGALWQLSIRQVLGGYWKPEAALKRAKMQGFRTQAWHSTKHEFLVPAPLLPHRDFGFHVAIGSPAAAQERTGFDDFQLPMLLKTQGKSLGRRQGTQSLPLLVRANNPLRWMDAGAFSEPEQWSTQAQTALIDPGLFNIDRKDFNAPPALLNEIIELNRIRGYDNSFETRKKFFDELGRAFENYGFDSVIYRNEHEDAGNDSLFLWNPANVRSAFDLFDPRADGMPGLFASTPFLEADLRQKLNQAILDEGLDAYLPAFALRPVDRSGAPIKDDPNFKAWFGDSKVVDESGEPLIVYHGTLGDFSQFDKRMANPESDMGAGFYFSSHPEDIASNYTSVDGPDIRNRIDRQLEQYEGYDGPDAFYEEEEYDPSATDETEEEWNDNRNQRLLDRALEQVRASLGHANEGTSMPVYLKMENPAVIGEGDLKPTYLDFESDFDPETEEEGEETGALVEFIQAFRDVADEYDMRPDSLDAVVGDLVEAGYDGGLSLGEALALLKRSEDLMDVTDYDGNAVASEIARRALEKMGFDGIIDYSVPDKFGPGAKYGGMKGMRYDTVHYIAFKPTQIKSVFNRGSFDAEDPDILHALSPRQVEQTQTPEFENWFGNSVMKTADGQPMVLYHSTDAEFSAFDPARIGQGDPGWLGAGFYFTGDKEWSEQFGATTMPVYLRLENPFIVDNFDPNMLDRIRALPGAEAWMARTDRRDFPFVTSMILDKGAPEFSQMLKEAGYDGIATPDLERGEVVVFEPEQIKSVENRGSFDPGDPDILHALSPRSADRTQTPEFKRWFEGSAVVDENGEPLVVYHGSDNQISEFRTQKGNRYTFGQEYQVETPAFFFTPDTEFAESFGQQVVAAYIRMQKPLDLTEGAWGQPDNAALSVLQSYFGDRVGFLPPDELWQILDDPASAKAIRDLGYDGVIFRERDTAGESHDTYAVFEPTQIKSAIGNRGTFDPSDPNILHAFAGERALTADLTARDKALELEAEGVLWDEIWEETGWVRGTEGRWKFEISDADAEFILDDRVLKKALDGNPVELGEVYNHPHLYRAYPQLKSTRIVFNPDLKLADAIYQPAIDNLVERLLPKALRAMPTIEIGLKGFIGSNEEMVKLRGALTHEIQHAIQALEDFAAGSNPWHEGKQLQGRIKGGTLTDRDLGWLRVVKDRVKAPAGTKAAAKEKLDRLSYALYRSEAGEMEAEVARERMDMPQNVGRRWAPDMTQGTPPWMIGVTYSDDTLTPEQRYTAYLKDMQRQQKKPISFQEFKKK